MDSLRWVLLLLGALFVLGIYLYGTFRSKNQPKRRSEVIFNQDTSADFYSNPKGNDILDYDDVLGEAVQVREKTADILSEPNIEHESERGPRISDETLKQYESEESKDKDLEENLVKDKQTEEEQNEEQAIDVIMLRIVCKSEEEFRGLKILIATKDVDMKFGKMNIFHHYGVGELSSDAPLFSLANMYEPGEFKLEEMESFSTKGLVVYMPLPTPLPADMSFELMLNTAQRIAEQLDAELRDESNQTLDDNLIQAMRDKARRFLNSSLN